MKAVTIRLLDYLAKKLRHEAEMEHRTISEQIKKYISDGMLPANIPIFPCHL